MFNVVVSVSIFIAVFYRIFDSNMKIDKEIMKFNKLKVMPKGYFSEFKELSKKRRLNNRKTLFFSIVLFLITLLSQSYTYYFILMMPVAYYTIKNRVLVDELKFLYQNLEIDYKALFKTA